MQCRKVRIDCSECEATIVRDLRIVIRATCTRYFPLFQIGIHPTERERTNADYNQITSFMRRQSRVLDFEHLIPSLRIARPRRAIESTRRRLNDDIR
jgi:hypothetical protein